MTELDGTTFAIEELESADGAPPRRVELAGRDAPIGGRGSGGAFDLTTELRQTEHYYPGRLAPTRHVTGAKYLPIELEGNLQDRGVIGRADNLARELEELALRGRRVCIAWGRWAYLGIVESVTKSPETLRDINYKLRLAIDGPDLPATAVTVATPQETTPTDAADTVKAAATSAGAALDDAARGLSKSDRDAVTAERDAFVGAARDWTAITSAMDSGVALTAADAGRLAASASTLAAAARAFAGRAADVLPPDGAGWPAAVRWQSASLAAAEDAWSAAVDALAAADRLDALARGANESAEVAREGATLESIARERLGDEGRAAEIARRNALPGYRLATGQRVTLPVR